MRILSVAEKPSAAKQIAHILSQGRPSIENTRNTYIKNYRFDITLDGRSHQMTVTSVAGHVRNLDLVDGYGWNQCPIEALFTAPLRWTVKDENETVVSNLRREAQRSNVLFIWTDCDREGEAIGAAIRDICFEVNSRLEVWRARFSALDNAGITRAARTPTRLDDRLVQAVHARMELDLRIGYAFTRLQTTRLRSLMGANKKLLSYGPCQFPTLGFVVDRYMAIKNFVPERFWRIDMEYMPPLDDGAAAKPGSSDNNIRVKFNWKRGHLFDYGAAVVLYESCVLSPMAVVTRVHERQTTKRKPLPLTTVELQKTACRVLGLSSAAIMHIAESLYMRGLISYPRTETDQFESNFNFENYIRMQRNDQQWGQYAQLLMDGEFERPRDGKNNDKAHPPIHPTGYDQNLSGDDRKVYEFIVRRFLGCCWKDAVGFETTIEAKIATEEFTAKGLVILERNYLEVYTYDRWSDQNLPRFQEGEQFVPSSLLLNEGKTEPPKPLTEPELISLMEKNEIGTDATISDHIQTIQTRQYAFKQGQYFHPTTLGVGLVLGYDAIGFETSLSKPFLRRATEADLKAICEGRKISANVISTSIEQYRQMFERTEVSIATLLNSVRRYYNAVEDERNAWSNPAPRSLFGDDNGGSGRGQQGRGRSSSRGSRSTRGGGRSRIRGGRGRGRGQG